MSDTTADPLAFLSGGGAMGELIRARDWSATPLGPPEQWPQSLRTTLSLCLASNFPLCFIWGPERVQFYNDGYWPICAAKHPQSMGQDYRECWASAWPSIGANFERCAQHGEASFITDARMFLDRKGFLEETFFTYSYSPIRDESGAIAGIFHPVTETTQLVLAERRLRVLRQLAEHTAGAGSVDAALARVADALAEHAQDLPFVLLYRTQADADGTRRAHRIACAGLDTGSGACADALALDGAEADAVWPLAEAARGGRVVEVGALAGRFDGWACGPYDEPPHSALVCPVSLVPNEPPSVFLVAGASARRPLDDAYRGFYAMLAEALTTAVAKAHAYAEEKRRAEALAALDQAKTAFFSNVSHEFRTPLTLMLGPLDELLARSDIAGVRRPLQVIHRNGQRLLKLVNTLLDFARIEAGRAQAAFEPTDLAALTAELCGMFRAAIEQAGLRLRVDCAPLPRPVPVDREMWETIVFNLLSNAFKFTFDGEIAVSLQPDGDSVRLEVRDSGTGIPADQLAHVFERFHRVDGAVGRSFEGSGIGLALVRELVRMHGGSIGVSSRVGEGTVFSLRVPAERREPSAAAAADAPRVPAPAPARGLAFLDEMRQWARTDDAAPATVAAGGAAHVADADGAGRRPRILLADDNADMRDYVCGLLGERYDVQAVGSGDAALAAAQRQPPDVVLTDVMMPGLDGFGLLAALRADPATRALPVIMLSARAGDEARVDGLDAGADDYLVKPFGARELRARVRTHLELARMRRHSARAEERERHAQQVELQARLFDTALSHTADLVYTFDRNGRFSYANRALLELLQRRHDEVVGRSFAELGYPAELAARLQRDVQLVLDGGGPLRDEAPFNGAHGTRSYEYIFTPVVAADGSVVAVSGSTRDITDRLQALHALQQSDRRKDEFLAMLAHELRNPLSAVGNAASVLSVTSQPQRVAFATDIIKRQVRQLARLIDDLLDVSRITRGKIGLQCEPLDAALVLRQALESVRALIDERGHTLRVDIEPTGLPLLADPTRLEQIVVNLLTNAAKYTEHEGRIELSARRRGAEVVIEVCDDGIGIAPEKIDEMFEMFAQGERSIARSEGGLGIGLTLVQKLAELHGGSVQAHSDGAGRGSRFTVRLPAADAPADRACADGADGVADAGRAGSRILVVDDNVDTATGMALLFEMLGAEVHAVHEGPSAIEAAQRLTPQFVLLDIGLPGMDGYQVAEQLRRHPRLRHAMIIAISGYGRDEDRRRSAEAGFDHHLVKPVDFDALVSLMGLSTPALPH